MKQNIDKYIIGMDIGGTKLATVVADGKGQILKKIRKSTEAEKGAEHVIDKLCDMVHETLHLAKLTLDDVIGIGVSFGGETDTRKGLVYPHLPGWEAYPMKGRIESEFNLLTIIENDANAGALAEWMFGAGRGYDYVVYMTMGTGIGGGIVANGQIYHGANDSAGEVGHQILLPDGPPCRCGKHGCLEALCAGPGIARRAQEAIRKEPDTLILELADGDIDAVKAEFVVESAKQNDPIANRLIEETGFYMGWGITNLVNIVNPEIVAIGTIAVAAGDLLLNPIRDTVKKLAVRRAAEVVKIVPAQLGDLVGDLAAIALVIQAVRKAKGQGGKRAKG
ncbi:ROK family protein [Candidatus Poribacteria bacterium]|nr:ROK family protein [Candidatus Poribacteria bacterium]